MGIEPPAWLEKNAQTFVEKKHVTQSAGQWRS